MDWWIDTLGKWGVGGAVVGMIGAAFAYFLERRRSLFTHRRALVEQWRKELLPAFESPQQLGKGSTKYPFMRLPAYASLRPHLSPKFLKRLEGNEIVFSLNGDFPRRALIEEIARIEKDWQLV